MKKKHPVLGVFTLSMINLAAILSLRGLPATSTYGLEAVSFYLIAALMFFIPCSLVSAELATAWPSRGGVYTWVSKALNQRWGFLAVWLQWAQNIFYFPTLLSFVAASFAFAIDPVLAYNKIYVVSVIIGVYWFFTFVNFLGMKVSGLVSTVCVILGTLIPGAFLVILGGDWLLNGHALAFSATWSQLVPKFNHLNHIVFFVSILLTLSGMEMSAVHANEVKDPQKDYSKAIFISMFLIIAISILGSLSISAVVPAKQVTLVGGVMEAFRAFLSAYHLEWMTPVIAVLITLGAVGQVSTWIAGPSKGLLNTAHDGNIPPIFQKMNRHHMPVAILIIQGVFVTVLALLFLFMPSVSSSYWILTVITAQMYLLMYILMFIAAIRLRYVAPNAKRPYRISKKGNVAMWFIAGLGIIGSIFAVVIGFFPPAQLSTGNIGFYEGFLGIGLIVMLVLPNVIYSLRKKSWRN